MSDSDEQQTLYAAQGFVVGVFLGLAVLYHAAHAPWTFEKTIMYYLPAFWTPIALGIFVPILYNEVTASV